MDVGKGCLVMHTSTVLEGASKAEQLFWVWFCLEDA